MLAQTLQGSATQSGLRPFNPFRDLAQVADLVQDAFREELALTGSEIVAEMRRWAGWRSLLWLLDPPDLLSGGFVWVEEGRIVGNVSLGLANPRAGYWLITNVAVYPEYRRRGIARRLMETALEWTRAQGASKLFLQVSTGNEAARQLYQSLGFSTFHTAIEMRRAAGSAAPAAAALVWRELRPSDAAAARELIEAAVPPQTREYQFTDDLPQSRRTFDDWLNDWLSGRRTAQRVADAGARLGALIRTRSYHRATQHSLTVLIHPAEQGRLEREAVAAGLALLQEWPACSALTTVSGLSPEIVLALTEAGFMEVRRLDQMKLEF